MVTKKGQNKKHKSIRCVWSLLCSLSSIDQEKNNVSLFNVFEQINVPEKAFVQQKKKQKPLLISMPHEVVFLLRRTSPISDNELHIEVRLELVDPSGEILQETVAPFKIEEKIKRQRIKVAVNALRVTMPGDYEYRIGIKHQENKNFSFESAIPFEVVEVQGGIVRK